MTWNLLVTEQRACENFVEVGTGKVFEYSELYRVYKNIATNVEAMKDWVVFDMLINKRCDQIQNDPTEKQLCDLYVQGNQITIKNNLNILPLDKWVMLSLLSNTNQCNNDKDCEFDIWLVQKMRARNGWMPDIKNSRLIEWYLYYKQSPNDYNDAIKKLFLELCLK